MSLNIPNKELFHSKVVSNTKAEVEKSIQLMVDIVPTADAVKAIDSLIEQLKHFRPLLASTNQMSQESSAKRQPDVRKTRQQL